MLCLLNNQLFPELRDHWTKMRIIVRKKLKIILIDRSISLSCDDDGEWMDGVKNDMKEEGVNDAVTSDSKDQKKKISCTGSK